MKTPEQTISRLQAEYSWYETDPEAAKIGDWYAAHAMNECIDGIATCRRALARLVSLGVPLKAVRDTSTAAGSQSSAALSVPRRPRVLRSLP